MEDNITQKDLDTLIGFLKGKPRLTQSANVLAFEKEWSEWLGVKHSVYVNSGASANLITMAAIREIHGEGGEIIVPTLTWVSDIATVLQNGFKPVFVDINPDNLGMSDDEIIKKITPKTKAVFLTYVQGFNCLTDKLLKELKKRKIPLIEDVCESHGATFKGKKLGSFGLVSNFSYYFAHHMSTIEGGMVCTNDSDIYEMMRMFRSHGMVRESLSEKVREKYKKGHPDLNPDFIFAFPAYNVRNTEIGAVLGRSQLKKLDSNNEKRRANFKLFIENLDAKKYKTDFEMEGSCNYALALVIKKPDLAFRDRLEAAMRDACIEFRRGSSGGGNQLRQPYVKKIMPKVKYSAYPNVEHIHSFGYYVGNFPELKKEKILQLCKFLNAVK
jgi:CDP-6-deoxy-D-xylo-4-hexulose-3-dehydrase